MLLFFFSLYYLLVFYTMNNASFTYILCILKEVSTTRKSHNHTTQEGRDTLQHQAHDSKKTVKL